MRQRVFEIITDEETDSPRAHVYDSIMVLVILASLVPLCFKDPAHHFILLERVCTVVFVIDYLLRWWCADLTLPHDEHPHLRYPTTLMAVVDLVSIVPTFLPVSQVLRLSRVVRLLRVMRAGKLLHHSRSIQLVAHVFVRERIPLLVVLYLTLAYVFVSALLVFNAEPDTFDTFFDALYWSVISLTTIGYGDIYTTSVAGKVVSIVSALVGIAIVALPSGIITAGFVEELHAGPMLRPKRDEMDAGAPDGQDRPGEHDEGDA